MNFLEFLRALVTLRDWPTLGALLIVAVAVLVALWMVGLIVSTLLIRRAHPRNTEASRAWLAGRRGERRDDLCEPPLTIHQLYGGGVYERDLDGTQRRLDR